MVIVSTLLPPLVDKTQQRRVTICKKVPAFNVCPPCLILRSNIDVRPSSNERFFIMVASWSSMATTATDLAVGPANHKRVD